MESRIHHYDLWLTYNIFICHMTTNANIVFTYLENFHRQLAHSRLVLLRCPMDGGSVLGAVVQKVPGPPLSFLPVLLTLVMDKHRRLLELDL